MFCSVLLSCCRSIVLETRTGGMHFQIDALLDGFGVAVLFPGIYK